MRLLLTVVFAAGTQHRDVVVTVDDSASVGELAARFHSPSGTLWADGRPLDVAASVGDAVRHGAVIALDEQSAPATTLREPSGMVEVCVVSGPGAGRVARIGIGRLRIGNLDCAGGLQIADPALPPVAVAVDVAVDGSIAVVPQGAAATLDGAPMAGSTPWNPGAALRIGESVLTVAHPEAPDAHLTPMGDGGAAYNRPPRLRPHRRTAPIQAPTRPEKLSKVRLQLIGGLVPVVLGVGMWLATKSAMMLGMCAMSPLMLLGTYFSDKRFGKKNHRTAMKEYEQQMASFVAELDRARREDQWLRREAMPDPASVLLTATGPRRRLWERRFDDPDTLLLRVGLIDTVSSVTVSGVEPGDLDPAQTTVYSVPAAIPVAESGVVGIAGYRQPALGLLRWLLSQAVVHHSPRDLGVVILSMQPDAEQAWSWAQWLPHTAPRDGQDVVAMVGTDPETVSRRVAWLIGEIDRRRAEAESRDAWSSAAPEANILVVLDGTRVLRRTPGMPKVLSEGPRYGIYTLCLDEDERLLPEECKTVALWSPSGTRVTLMGGGLDVLGEVLAEQVTVQWAERLARALAPVRDVSRDDAGSGLPTSARLLTLLGMENPDSADIRRWWDRDGRTTESPLGYSADGVFTIDIRRDGPHALVAGTTGAGKSELLQTWVAGLAVVNRPDSLNFVLIDYKGGSAFLDCARLPHTVGMVSDLDAHLTRRALDSLAAELKRREEILFEAAAKDIETYWDAKRLRPELAPLPRLMLIIDEFAALFAELPEFIVGLVDIARRGRSLGVHLVLATQRPAGVVSGDIRANTNLRIALRVTSAEESMDVVESRDSALISKSTPGRCNVRSGAAALTAVQAARVGGRRPSADVSARPAPAFAEISWNGLGRPEPKPAAAVGPDDDNLATDLGVLVDAIRAANQDLGYAPQRSPWLEPLPPITTLAELPPVRARDDRDVPPVGYGMLDLPAQQARGPLALDIVRGGHLAIVGAPRSGRSTVLRTIAGALAAQISSNDVHLYAVDGGANALLPLVALPHCGAVVTRDQPERVDRLLTRLLAEVARRQQLLAAQGASSLAEQRAMARSPEERLPWMVLMIDRWEGFIAAFEQYDMGRLVDSALRLFREGAAVGVRIVITGDRSLLSGQVSTVFEDRLLLRLTDVSDYGMAGIPPREVPGSLGDGRILVPTADGVLEAQVALLDPDPSGPAQVAAIQAIAREAEQRSSGPGSAPPAHRPLHVDPLPMRVTAREALALTDRTPSREPLWALVGVGGDDLAPVGVDLMAAGPGFVIAGPLKSGRSTALATMGRSLADRGIPIAIVTPRRSPLRDLAGEEGVLGVFSSTDQIEEFKEVLAGRERFTVLVDDAELIYENPYDEHLVEVLRQARDAERAIISAGSIESLSGGYRGLVADSRKFRSGLIISQQTPSDGDMFGVRLGRGTGAGPIGRGNLVTSGQVSLVQVAVTE
ncbi:FtsK/SpoIIIE domain-containing protein [Catenulispora pinisilvae]|uniref:FtsK/SpoIIIE domain-containing protein n=1 Tax=Catenulispora pinisilvae TaxID=2705253 RepID=UPI001891B445|nr:FtsK/SpoIIIE domain-containing protein [Catenulispora pinisilvae]